MNEPDAQLRALKVGQDGDRAPELRFDAAQDLRTRSRSRSFGRWLILRRNTSAPASKSLAIISGDSEAGPKVAMIFVRRERLIMIYGPPGRLVSVS